MKPARWLVVAALISSACGNARAVSSAYDGTVIIGTDYVQVLATAPDDKACQPRVHRAGVCVRSTAGAPCASAPACVTQLTVSAPDGSVLASADGGFVRMVTVPAAITVTIRGCGGTLTTSLNTEPPVAPFATATASIAGGTLDTSWGPVDPAIQVCALASGPGFRELCCTEDVGVASFPLTTPAEVTSARLSRGRLLHRAKTRAGTVDYYRTTDTANILR